MINKGPSATAERGFTLVEALVALIVLSIGLLGIAALYVETLRANRTALVRTQAVTLAADLADRIRANRAPAGAYSCPDPCDPDTGGNAIAVADLTEWLANVNTQIPGGAGIVTFVDDGVANTPDAYTIRINWTEVGQDDPIGYELRVEI